MQLLAEAVFCVAHDQPVLERPVDNQRSPDDQLRPDRAEHARILAERPVVSHDEILVIAEQDQCPKGEIESIRASYQNIVARGWM